MRNDAPPARPIVTISDLVIEFRTRRQRVRALDGASLSVAEGEKVGLVGESGSGKSTLALSLARLLPTNAEHVSGDLTVAGKSIFAMDTASLRAVRRRTLSYVFQDPIGTLDPTMRVGRQISSVLNGVSQRSAVASSLLEVGLTDHKRIARSYPHELSGGMAQRVSIAVALAAKPQVVIADEPTASLDASIRAQILDLLVSLCAGHGTALVLLSHDLRAIAHYCERVAVMYGGRVVEDGPTANVFSEPFHPYSRALMKAAPGQERLGGRIEPIPGVPPILGGREERCTFAPRCRFALESCHSERPGEQRTAGRRVICHRVEGGLPPLPR